MNRIRELLSAIFSRRSHKADEERNCLPRIVVWSGDGSYSSPFEWLTAHGHLDTIESSLLYARLKVAPYLQKALEGAGACSRCRIPVLLVRTHDTRYTRSNSCFPLCEDCWRELGTPEARLPYYMELVDEWEVLVREPVPGVERRDYSVVRRQIRDAVFMGN